MDEFSVEVSESRILVVDDLPANLDVLCQALEQAGYQVMVATSGQQALGLAGQFVPDLILLDVIMPGLDGFAVCRRLKQEESTRAIPVLFLTARDDTADLVEGFRAGGVDYVIKPFQKEEVLVRVQTHLEKAGLVRALRENNAALEAEIARRQALTHERNHLAGRLSLANEREAQRWGLGAFVGQSPTLKKVLEDVDLLQNAPHTSVLIEGESGTGKELIARVIHTSGPRREGPFVPVNCSSIPHELADSLLFGHLKGAFTGADQDQIGYFELAHGGTLFLDEMCIALPEINPRALARLEEYGFPGNVRELKNLMERALIESRGGEIRPEHLLLPETTASPAEATGIEALQFNLEQAELLLIQRALEHSGGNISGAARLLGVERTKIYRRLGQIEKQTPADESA